MYIMQIPDMHGFLKDGDGAAMCGFSFTPFHHYDSPAPDKRTQKCYTCCLVSWKDLHLLHHTTLCNVGLQTVGLEFKSSLNGEVHQVHVSGHGEWATAFKFTPEKCASNPWPESETY